MLKQIKWRSILVGIGYILAGLLLIVYPESSRDLIAYVLGIVALLVSSDDPYYKNMAKSPSFHVSRNNL